MCSHASTEYSPDAMQLLSQQWLGPPVLEKRLYLAELLLLATFPSIGVMKEIMWVVWVDWLVDVVFTRLGSVRNWTLLKYQLAPETPNNY